VLLVCQRCEYAWEPVLFDSADRAEAMSMGCPDCGDWLWFAELAEGR